MRNGIGLEARCIGINYHCRERGSGDLELINSSSKLQSASLLSTLHLDPNPPNRDAGSCSKAYIAPERVGIRASGRVGVWEQLQEKGASFLSDVAEERPVSQSASQQRSTWIPVSDLTSV